MEINKNEVKNFFNNIAQFWDDEQVDRTKEINEILDVASWDNPLSVLDVACGSGILFPYYLNRNIEKITGIDISSEMILRAKKKIDSKMINPKHADKINLLCADIERVSFDKLFDLAVVYNAYPHFPDGDKLIKKLSTALKPSGRLIIAHGFSRDTINKHHIGLTCEVSRELEDAIVLAKRFELYFNIDTVVSDDEKYIVSGVLKKSK